MVCLERDTLRRVSLNSFRSGMRLARPVYDSYGNVLLTTGAVITRKYASKLLKYGICSVYIDDGLLPDHTAKDVIDVISEKTRQTAINQVKDLFMEASEGVIIGIDKIQDTVSDMVNQLSLNKSIVNMLDLRTLDEYTFYHSVNVCVLSIMTGINMGYDHKDLHILGMGAILHDLGKAKIPANILNKPGKLTFEEFDVIKKHPSYGYEHIKRSGDIDPAAALVSYEHHERFNGSGYPEGKQREAIHPFSRIVGIADVYDAITAERVYKKACSPLQAYEMLAGSGNCMYDYKAVSSFLDNIAAYPTGSIVQLTTGETAVVVDTPKGYALLPRVSVFTDPEGKLLKTPYEIKLFDMEKIAVVKSLTEEEFENLKKTYIQN